MFVFHLSKVLSDIWEHRMGACAGFNKNEGRGSRELKQGAKSKPRRESKLGVSMQSECINLMLQKIISN